MVNVAGWGEASGGELSVQFGESRHVLLVGRLLRYARPVIRFRDRGARGHARRGWAESWFSFSFGDHFDPRNMGFRSLRVLNEDIITPGAGFPAHAHEDMEIVTYVLSGTLRHEDDLGNGALIEPGDVQRMSAGTGIRHSEFNPSASERAHLLQIWIIPDRRCLDPGYEQKRFSAAERRNQLITVASAEGSDGAITIHQDARILLGRLDDGAIVTHSLADGRGAWLQVARGLIALNDTEMRESDGAAIEGESELVIEALTDAEILLFDLA